MTRPLDPDIKALKGAGKALAMSSSRRMLLANLEFLWDYFVRHPSKQLPPHLRVGYVPPETKDDTT